MRSPSRYAGTLDSWLWALTSGLGAFGAGLWALALGFRLGLVPRFRRLEKLEDVVFRHAAAET